MNSIITHLLTFSSGLIIGIFGTYFANRLSDKAKQKDLQKADLKEFLETKKKMPELIHEMKSDLQTPRMESCREFFISPSKSVIFNLSRPAFGYYEDEHDNLMSKVRILESLKFVHDITEGRTPKYQFNEKFVDFLLNDT